MSHESSRRLAPAETDEEGVQTVVLARFEGKRSITREDVVGREEPLQIQLERTPFAVVMRTPGHDEELVLGLLLSEGIIKEAIDVASIRHCTIANTPEADGNVIRVGLCRGVVFDRRAVRRNLYSTSSCGICGKETIDAVLRQAPLLSDSCRFAADFFYALPERLAEGQDLFARTGGLHAAGLFDGDGNLLVVREDIGRHNAVDKVVGWAARHDHLPLTGSVLAVSGRISYEIAQKALAARVPVVAAVSAPSSLAVELAERARMTLVGFLRGRRLNVYGMRERVQE